MVVEMVPNREKYEEIYPEDPEDEDEDSPELAEDPESSDESDAIKALNQEKQENADSRKQADEKKASAAARLAMLEKYAGSVEKDRPQEFEARMKLYQDQRKEAFYDHFSSEDKLRDIEKERLRTEKKYRKAYLALNLKKEKAAKEQRKLHEARQEKQAAKDRVKEERIKFWPRKYYRVIISFDTNSDMTPATSRRGSFDSLVKSMAEESSDSSQISLSISYITHSAWWSPHYDLSLSTTIKSGLLTYRAEFCNTTSETWKDAKVTLSTSQTVFQGLGEPIPSIQPWHIRLGNGSNQYADSTNGALFSAYELQHKQQINFAASNKVGEPRDALFGLGGRYKPSGLFSSHEGPGRTQQDHQRIQHMQQQQQALARERQHGPQGFGQASNLFASSTAPHQQVQQSTNSGSLFGNPRNNQQSQVASTSGGLFGNLGASQPSQPSEPFEDFAETIVPEIPSLAIQESEWSETGMTASYEIPGARTIPPGDTKRRHKITSIPLKDVNFSHILVPKLRAAAFLKARIRNTSSITLLKGPVGLTLDGSFLGNASLPHSSAGQPFSLSLGVDPSVIVTYAKPVVKRSQTGVFQKEGSGVYTRTCSITNTKADRSLEGVVQDQVPVSEDERLKVDILQPSGLRGEGDATKSGTGVAAVGKAIEKWGSAKATLRKAGEVHWNINIEPGRGVKLVLEYEARFPSTETVVGC